jgi:NSS family neurotransmitter:Na+ symporter
MSASSSPATATSAVWSTALAAYFATAGAAVGLGSIWRFPYLAGVGGGSAFILLFILACLLIATPLLTAEFALGRRSRRSPPEAAGALAGTGTTGSRWNTIGILGTAAAFLIFSYYSVIAGWVLAYSWKCAAGLLSQAGPTHVSQLWHEFRSNPLEVGAWHAAFVVLVVLISARGLQRGIEAASKSRAWALLALLLFLVIYSVSTGDVRHGFEFVFTPRFSAITPQVALAAIGQAFYATGVGQAMMIAYGAYLQKDTSLVRTALVITGSILLVSLLAAIMVFPLVFGYGLNPAQGSELVFEVLPRVFAEMSGGRFVGTIFFILLVLAALMPSIALLEPTVVWLSERWRIQRAPAVCIVAGAAWVLGIASVLSLSSWSSWYPLDFVPTLAHKTFFDVVDYVSSNYMLPIGALLTSVFVGWRLGPAFAADELSHTSRRTRIVCIWLLRWVCPLAILAVFVATFA